MYDMSVTELVSKSSGKLKEVAPENMLAMEVTELVSKSSGRLKVIAL